MKVIIFLLSSTLLPQTFAQSSCADSMAQLLKCVESRAPEILRSKARLESASKGPAVGAERLNPQLNIQALKAGPRDPTGDSVQSNLLFPLNHGSIRDLKTRSAQLDFEEAGVSHEMAIRKLIIEDYLSLHRIRQLSLDIEFLQETQSSVEKAIGDFRRRPRLNAQQDADLELLRFGLAEIQSHLALLNQEKHALEHEIEIQIGAPWIPDASNLPIPPGQWPRAPKVPLGPDSIALRLETLKGESLRTMARLGKEEKKVMYWLGPSLEWNHLDPQSGVRMGLALNLNLPLLESHRASTEYSRALESQAVVEVETKRREIEGEWNHQLELYESSVASHAAVATAVASPEKLRQLLNRFHAGQIAASTYLEAARQRFAVLENMHRLEIVALDSWCELMSMQNKVGGCVQ